MTIAELFPKEFLRIIGITKQCQLDKFRHILSNVYEDMTEGREEQYDDNNTVANAFAMLVSLTGPDAREKAEMWDKITKKENFES
jgi:hypothetical protein